jgi:hypothetical protein
MEKTPKTVIINLHHTKRCDVFCDRFSIFGNPFDYQKMGITRDEACELFIPYFKNKLTNPEFRDKVLALRGKVLGCWCVPKRCHVQTIVEYVESNR